MAEQPPFEIDVDLDAGVVRTVCRGLWTMDDMLAFGAGMARAVQAISARHPVFGMLSDSSEFLVQTAEVSAEFARQAEIGNRGRTGPTALIMRSALNKLQAKRMFPDPRVHVFTDHAEARRWLEAELAAQRG